VLDTLRDRITTSTILVFDELLNYPEYRSHELLALWASLRDRFESVQIIGHSIDKIDEWPTRDVWPQAVALRPYKYEVSDVDPHDCRRCSQGRLQPRVCIECVRPLQIATCRFQELISRAKSFCDARRNR
jgi:hypothetical protein